MSTPHIIVFPRGQLSNKDKERITRAGMLWLEADDPKTVVQLLPMAPLVTTGMSGDLIVRSALKAIAAYKSHDDYNKITGAGLIAHNFVTQLANGLKPEGQQP